MPVKLVVIVGPTSSGKSEFAVNLAKKVNGEVISADSRQVYRGLNIGSGKVAGKWEKKSFIYKSIVHYAIDITNPRRQYSVSQFKKLAESTILTIHRRGKVPIICGGTGHWIDAVVFNQSIPTVKPNAKLRRQLEKKSVAELYQQLKKLDPDRAQTIDVKNPRRLIRALEIILMTGKPVPHSSSPYVRGGKEGLFDVTWLGLNIDQKPLDRKIDTRLRQRINRGMFKEIKNLHAQGITWKRLESFGLEYKYGALYLQGKLSYQDAVSQLSTAIKQYSKRQMTWWKRNKDINWVSDKEAKKLLKTI